MNARLVICADDFGRSAAINYAVLSLARLGKLTAASVMVDEPHTVEGITQLLAISTLQIGLHLTFTDAPVPSGNEGPNDMLPSIDRLTLDAYRRHLSPSLLEAEVHRQFDAFEHLTGRSPDFVDAHQHAHLLPGIREAVLDVTARRSRRIWVRSCEDDVVAIARRGGDRIRAWRSAWLSRGMRDDAAARGLVTNDGFAGLYDLRSPGMYGGRFPLFLRHPGSRNHLVIVHPAIAAEPGDEIGAARADEFRYLLHAPIGEMASREGLAIGAFQ